MKLKFSLDSPGGATTDLVATVDAATTVGDLARYLVQVDPTRRSGAASAPAGGGDFTLSHVDEGYRAVDPRLTLAEAGLRSGAHLTVTRRSDSYVDQSEPAAVAVVTTGPDAGREFALQRGTSYVGRSRGVDVRLSDPSVSRRHAKVLVTDVVEVVDLGSANGISAGGDVVDRAMLGAAGTVSIGDTELQLRVVEGAAGVVTGSTAGVAFARSPRLSPVYEGTTWKVPDLPERGRKTRMPWIAIAIPALLGLGLFAFTRSIYSLLFVFLTPLMMLGMAVEQRRDAKRDFEDDMRDFRDDLGLLVQQIRGALATEQQVRFGELPSAQECCAAVGSLAPLVWTRRPGEPGFAHWRLGTGRQPSRSTIEMPEVGRSKVEAWQETSASLDGLNAVDDVPVAADPLQDGAVGVAGPRPQALAAVRALVTQTVALHSPAEVVLAAFASERSSRDWDWLKWLPHVASAHSPVEARHLASTGPACSALLSELEDLLAGRALLRERQPKAPPEPVVVVLVEDDAPVDRARLVQLAERGWHRGVVVLWHAERLELLPAACRTYLHVAADGSAQVGYVGESRLYLPVQPDVIDATQALTTARAMSAVVDSGAPVDDDSDLPRAVSLLSLTGPELATSPDAVIERWGESRSVLTGPYAPERLPRQPGTLRAVVGQSAQGPLTIDLRADGPHALVGGTTGSGKSELLQAWILGMAAAHSPQRVTFLLVDYKGGSAFRDCVNLPHTVGLVTDLRPHLVRRALASLSAELRHREHLLAQHKAKDLVELERRGEVDAPPSLIIVVDEFAALVQEVPEFVDGVVNVAQRGRSLGLHLVLATQRPAGVIKDNLRANTNLRLALRMADESDSTDVLDSPVAAFFDPALPGRAVSKTGPGRLTPFQTAYAGGWTADADPAPEMAVETLTFGGAVQWLPPVDDDLPDAREALGPTDIQRLVGTITGAAAQAELPAPRKPWLPELADHYELAALPTSRRDDELVFAVGDDPDHQQQPVVSFRPDLEGNLAVFGASGSGKSVLLRSLAVAAGYTVRGGPCHVYGLDFAGRGLSMLESLPHVGAVVHGSDDERMQRLLGHLRETIDERAERYSRVSAATITEYRRLADAPQEPRVLLLVDGLTAFRQANDTAKRQRWLDLFTSIAADGRPVGVHVVVAIDQRAGMWPALGAAVPTRLVLRMAHPDDYSFLSAPSDVLSLASPPGRGLLGQHELQVAVLGGTSDVSAQARAVTAFGAAMRKAGVPEAPPIRSLGDRMPLAELPPQADGRPVVGVSAETLGPQTIDPVGTFVVTGPGGSGRTTAVRTVVRAVQRWRPSVEAYLLSPKRSRLRDDPMWRHVAAGHDEICELSRALTRRLAEGSPAPSSLVVAVEGFGEVADGRSEDDVTELVKALVEHEQLVVVEGDTSDLSSGYGLPAVVKTSRSGIVLQPDGFEGQSLFRTDLPAVTEPDVPAGRGFVVQKGRAELAQVAVDERGVLPIDAPADSL
ncbi:MAG: FtsK/SpoIIIE domain-containing protein [Angustibacter sp.]